MMNPDDTITIAHQSIGPNHPPFIIAEMSGNHNQSLDRALAIVDAAAEAGAHALKLQTYTADTMTIDLAEGDFLISDPKSLWAGKSLYALYEEAHTPWDWHPPIFQRCRELGMICISTPFDATAVDFLEELQTPAYKIASFENTDLPLIRKAAATGKPLIISTGLATVAELDDTVKAAREAGCKDLILLKCTSAYPADPKQSNIATVPHMRELYQCQTGLSDHTLGPGASIAAVALGATVIEKHFTLKREDGGVDATFSLEPEEMATLVRETQTAWQAKGTVHYGHTTDESKSRIFRRSLYIVEDIKAGEAFSEKNLRAIRPGYGLAPKYYDIFLGKQAGKSIKRGTPLSWGLLTAE